MKSEIITSLQNPQIKQWRLLNKSRGQRMEQGLFIAEGEHMALEAMENKAARLLLVSQSGQAKYAFLLQGTVPVQVLADHVFSALCDAKSPQGILALCAYPENQAVEGLGNRIVCLNGVQDPGNVGTILRTMDAAGFTGLLIDDQTADPYAPKVLRATMGSIFRMPIVRAAHLSASLDALQAASYEIMAGDLLGEPFFSNRVRKEKICIIIGNEGAGIAPEIKEKATLRLKIPMMGGAESLNAAVAAAIMMYEDVRQRLMDP